MNGFKFTDLKCLAMMVLIIMAFCGDAGQYLLMAAALVWMFAKVLELHRATAPGEGGRRPKRGRRLENGVPLRRSSRYRQAARRPLSNSQSQPCPGPSQ